MKFRRTATRASLTRSGCDDTVPRVGQPERLSRSNAGTPAATDYILQKARQLRHGLRVADERQIMPREVQAVCGLSGRAFVSVLPGVALERREQRCAVASRIGQAVQRAITRPLGSLTLASEPVGEPHGSQARHAGDQGHTEQANRRSASASAGYLGGPGWLPPAGAPRPVSAVRPTVVRQAEERIVPGARRLRCLEQLSELGPIETQGRQVPAD